ncbi:hypothetical protein AVEN_183983-1 [Araneus ventricosus]|uniref:Uncharacterized protein n=1 Tax=Araneus ventricosus TaxID=182803 RepID=A0A4Y2E3V3_ARAVE|nr:hypothetical protein AVEN_183983-1 [Araneus ventricosus]
MNCPIHRTGEKEDSNISPDFKIRGSTRSTPVIWRTKQSEARYDGKDGCSFNRYLAQGRVRCRRLQSFDRLEPTDCSFLTPVFRSLFIAKPVLDLMLNSQGMLVGSCFDWRKRSHAATLVK